LVSLEISTALLMETSMRDSFDGQLLYVILAIDQLTAQILVL